mmetsp:Transcript_19656/g.42783  ORF Transcript_19656/g.42783 Transcript_19656/m.42783 type:complete len:476 (+) Transcript_19656:90-1517(+)
MAPVAANASAACEDAAVELLLQDAHPSLHNLIRQAGGMAPLCKDIRERLRNHSGNDGELVAGGAAPEELHSLGIQALALEELEDIVQLQWPTPQERRAVHRKLLKCGIGSPQALCRALETRHGGCKLNERFKEAGYLCLKTDTCNALAQKLEEHLRERIEVIIEGSRRLLVTAPHNIYLIRDGHDPHVMEEYTTLIAKSIARHLGGACLIWSRTEQRRSELNWFLARAQGHKDTNAGCLLDQHNRDPNYLTRKEVLQNPWFLQMSRLAASWSSIDADMSPLPTLHVDVHGCKDPPESPSHLTIGLGAMREEAESKGNFTGLTISRVEAFGAALKVELGTVLSGLDLPRHQGCGELVRVLCPSTLETGSYEHLSGAWAPKVGRLTQSQQAVQYAGFTHSCQLELSKALRLTLRKDDTSISRLARAISKAWHSVNGQRLPALGHESRSASTAPPHRKTKRTSGHAKPGRSCPPRSRT